MIDRKEFRPGLLHCTKRRATAMGIDPKDSRFGPLLPLDGTSLKPKRLENTFEIEISV